MIQARHRRVAYAVGFVGALLVVACQQLLSIDGTVTVASREACGLAAPPGSCQSCVAASCCDQAAACASDPGCSSYESCLLACGADYGCRARCVAANRVVAGDTVPKMDQCVVAHCEGVCGVSCGATGSYAEPDAAQACQDCISARSCGNAEACGSNLDCEEIGHCALGCISEDCPLACANAHPDAAAGFNSLIFGVGSECLTVCSVGKYFECLGRVAWPLAKSQNLTVTLSATSSAHPNGTPGLTVKACNTTDVTCSNPLVQGTTDSQGSVKLAFPTIGKVAYGFKGYFDVSGPGIMPYLIFLSAPLSEEQGALTLFLVAPADFAALTSLLQSPAADGGMGPFVAEADRGVVAVSASDCFFNAAPEVVVDATGTDSRTVEAYLEGPVLSGTATMTDRSGLAFFLNAPTGTPIGIKTTPQVVGRQSSSVVVFARAGSISYIHATPTP